MTQQPEKPEYQDMPSGAIASDLAITTYIASHKVGDTEERCHRHMFFNLTFITEEGTATVLVEGGSPLGQYLMAANGLPHDLAEQVDGLMPEFIALNDLG